MKVSSSCRDAQQDLMFFKVHFAVLLLLTKTKTIKNPFCNLKYSWNNIKILDETLTFKKCK